MGRGCDSVRGMWLGALLAIVAVAASARADVSTERPGSIVIFPKVIASGTRDTIIQISNTSNSMVHAHCFYVDAALQDPTRPLAQDNLPLCIETDFDIWLTKQQPTHWIASIGRGVNPVDPGCTSTNQKCSDAGIDPSRVPPLAPDFVGELRCIEVDSSGAPISGNHLKGEATIVVTTALTAPINDLTTPPVPLAADPVDSGDASKYNALTITGLDSNDADLTLCLGGGVTPECPRGAEYDACPQTTILDDFSSGANNPQLQTAATTSTVNTELTVVPCTARYETQTPSVVTVQFSITNEFEETFSASTTTTCWGNYELSQINRIFTIGFVGSRFLQTRMGPATNDYPGIVTVAEEFHHLTQNAGGAVRTGRAAFNLHAVGTRPVSDVITIPEGP